MAYVNFLCIARSKNVTVNTVPSTTSRLTSGEDIEESQSDTAGNAPIIRYGISKSGECKITIDDRTANTQTLATILALRSPKGEGDYTISVNGVACSWHAIIQVSLDGAMAQFATIKWMGTING